MDIDIISQNMEAARLKKNAEKKIDPARDKALRDACAGFEAIFTHTMLKQMRQSLPGDALFPESNATSIYTSMHDQHLAQMLSQGSSGMGLRDFLYEQLKDSI